MKQILLKNKQQKQNLTKKLTQLTKAEQQHQQEIKRYHNIADHKTTDLR